jgi:HSP20 family molecular chaperone IbpA
MTTTTNQSDETNTAVTTVAEEQPAKAGPQPESEAESESEGPCEPESETPTVPFAAEMAASRAKMAEIVTAVGVIDALIARHQHRAKCLGKDGQVPSSYDKDGAWAARHNRYESGMQSEHLMKHLMQLDNCLSYGSAEIKAERKQLVRRIEQSMVLADSISKQWLARVQVYDTLETQAGSESSTSDATDTDAVEQAGPATTPGFRKMEVDQTEQAGSEDDADSSEEESEPEEQDQDMEQEDAPAVVKPAGLPTWRPEAQLFQDASHVIFGARLPGVSLQQLDIAMDGDELRVRGAKQPSRSNLLAYSRGAKPSFGTLDLRVALPVSQIRVSGATASIEGGILQVKFPKAAQRYHPPAHTRYRQPEAQGWPGNYHSQARQQRSRQQRYRQPFRAGGFGRSPFSSFL